METRSKSIFFFVLAIIILLLLSVPVYRKYKKQAILSDEVSSLKKEIEQLESRNQDLGKMISYLESSDFIEAEARKKLNYRKPGEELYVIKDGVEGGGESAEAANKQSDYSKPQKWIRYFFN